MYKIYGLKVRNTDDIRYIGLTKRSLKIRLYHHLYESRNGKTYNKCNWIRDNDYNIDIVLIENCDNYDLALNREAYWVSQYNNLTNMTKGGKDNPMDNLEVIIKQKENYNKIPKNKFKQEVNWMSSDEGRKWISEENKRRWQLGIYKQKNKHLEYDILYDLYITQNKTLKECAIILNTTYRNIVRNVCRLNIKKYNYGK